MFPVPDPGLFTQEVALWSILRKQNRFECFSSRVQFAIVNANKICVGHPVDLKKGKGTFAGLQFYERISCKEKSEKCPIRGKLQNVFHLENAKFKEKPQTVKGSDQLRNATRSVRAEQRPKP